jgi:hypothetical protein
MMHDAQAPRVSNHHAIAGNYILPGKSRTSLGHLVNREHCDLDTTLEAD